MFRSDSSWNSNHCWNVFISDHLNAPSAVLLYSFRINCVLVKYIDFKKIEFPNWTFQKSLAEGIVDCHHFRWARRCLVPTTVSLLSPLLSLISTVVWVSCPHRCVLCLLLEWLSFVLLPWVSGIHRSQSDILSSIDFWSELEDRPSIFLAWPVCSQVQWQQDHALTVNDQSQDEKAWEELLITHRRHRSRPGI